MTEVGAPDPVSPEIEVLPETSPVPGPLEVPELPVPLREPAPEQVPA